MKKHQPPKFTIKFFENMRNSSSKFYLDESSFNTDPVIEASNFSLTLNKLILTVPDHKVLDVWGYCPDTTWIKSSIEVPKCFKGGLYVTDDLESGHCYAINYEDWPIYFNENSGWVCIGNPKISKTAVEFLPNVVAVILASNLVSLWIKPVFFDYAKDDIVLQNYFNTQRVHI